MSIDVHDESGSDVDVTRLEAQARFVLDALRVHPLAELSVLLVDEVAMADLHVRFMDEPGPTDVLSFPMDELRETADGDEPTEGVLGDVVLCPEVAERQGREAGHGRDAELEMLLTHGILHLLGHDHAEPDEHRVMFDLQDRLVSGWRAAGHR